MFLLVDLVVILVGLVVVAAPIAFGAGGLGFLRGLTASLVAIYLGTFLFCALGHYGIDVKLWWLGLDRSGFTFEEQLRTVAPEDRDRAQRLINSRMGLPWPFRAIMSSVVLLTPYTCVAFPVARLGRTLLRRRRLRRSAV